MRAREIASGVDATRAGFRGYANKLQSNIAGMALNGILWNLLRQKIKPWMSVLDVGSGPGKYTLPLSKLAARVVAVEPSEQMADFLLRNIIEQGIENVTIVRQRWENADVGHADAVLCSHVLYDVDDVEPFLLKLNAHAIGLCFLAHHTDQYDPLFRELWQRLYGEERRPMPVFADLLQVLEEMGIPAVVAGQMRPQMRLSFATVDEAVEYCTERMALSYSDPGNRSLIAAHLRDLLEMVDGRLYAPCSSDVGVVWWEKY
ncbi:MAG: class I SAM-dependent methyltransferase [Chloroflexota bacterium]